MKWELELDGNRFSFGIIAQADCNRRAGSCVIPLLRNFQNISLLSVILTENVFLLNPDTNNPGVSGVFA